MTVELVGLETINRFKIWFDLEAIEVDWKHCVPKIEYRQKNLRLQGYHKNRENYFLELTVTF